MESQSSSNENARSEWAASWYIAILSTLGIAVSERKPRPDFGVVEVFPVLIGIGDVEMPGDQVTSKEEVNRNQVLERAAIADIIQRERAARDAALWDEMARYYHPDSLVDVAWFRGSGEKFVLATKKNWRTDAINFHEMGLAVVTVNKDRAIAETACTLHGFYKLNGIDVTSTGFVRLLWRAQYFGRSLADRGPA